MKKLLLSLFSLAFLVTKAQPTLTTLNFCPVIGEIYTTKTCSYTSPGPGGPSQTWNFSAITPTATGSTTMVAPGSIPGSGIYVGATLASNDGSGIGFTAVNVNTLQLVGVRPNPTVNIVYSNREDLMRFPFTMSNSYIDNFAATFTTSGTFYRTGTSTVTADGYGTLTTPAGTYTNVLRLHLQQVYKDSTWVGFPYQIYYNNDQYMWVTPGTHNSLLTISTLSTSVGPLSQFVVYLQGTSTGISEITSLISPFSLYPNPATRDLNLSLNDNVGSNVKGFIYDIAGTEIRNIKEFESPINISDLANGVYFLRLNINGVLSDPKKFVILK